MAASRVYFPLSTLDPKSLEVYVEARHVRVCPGMSSPPPERGGVGQRRHGLGCQGVGLVPTVREQERVWKVSQFSVLVSV